MSVAGALRCVGAHGWLGVAWRCSARFGVVRRARGAVGRGPRRSHVRRGGARAVLAEGGRAASAVALPVAAQQEPPHRILRGPAFAGKIIGSRLRAEPPLEQL